MLVFSNAFQIVPLTIFFCILLCKHVTCVRFVRPLIVGNLFMQKKIILNFMPTFSIFKVHCRISAYMLIHQHLPQPRRHMQSFRTLRKSPPFCPDKYGININPGAEIPIFSSLRKPCKISDNPFWYKN